MLVPLQQWICDTCGGVIQRPNEGFIEWQRVERAANGIEWAAQDFRIVHHAAFSPRRPADRSRPNPMRRGTHCYQHEDAPRRADLHLDDVTGEHAQPFLLSLIDAGPDFYGQPTANGVADLQEWIELARRLSTPYYEEARRYLPDAFSSGRFEGYGPEYVYRPDVLKSVIQEFGPEESGAVESGALESGPGTSAGS